MKHWRVIDQEVNGQLVSTTPAAGSVNVPIWKRMLDISCLLVAIPLLLPLISIIAVAVKVTSRGPMLFRQERVGFLGRKFTLYKFRTMTVDSDTAIHEAHVASLIESNGPMVKLDANGDSRLTSIGKPLRAAGLDELPQLINVLRGEMSLVGPRPCLPNEFEKLLPWQRERFHTLPGLSGLWQVSGKNRTTFSEMIDLDIQYVRQKSPWLDARIMLRTIPVMMDEAKRVWFSASSPS